MRHFLAIALASTFINVAPVNFVAKPAEAQTLFEVLFPRAAERRKKRRAARLERQRELLELERKRLRATQRKKIKKVTKVKAPTFFNYAATPMKTVRLTQLAKAFSAHEQKLLAAEALQQEKLMRHSRAPQTVPSDALADATTDSNVLLVSDNPDAVLNRELAEGVTTQTPDAPETAIAPTSEPNVLQEPKNKIVRLSAGHKLLNGIQLKARTGLGKALVEFYRENPRFNWIDEEGNVNARANAVLATVAEADAYGWHLEGYALPISNVTDYGDENERLRTAMSFEFSLTMAALRYMADARNGVVNPNKLSGYHDFSGLGGDYQFNISRLINSGDPASVMLSAHPRDRAFEALKLELASLRERAEGYKSVAIAPKTFLKPGQTSDQLSNIVEAISRKANAEMRSEHFDVFAVTHEDGLYTPDVVALVRDFQRSVGLKADGIVGRNTIARLKGGDPKIQLNKVRFAMERLRWHPDQLGHTHVFINQPAYRATYIQGGKPKLSMRTVVGKPSNQTNFFYDQIEYVEYNPYWGIPRSILVNEMLPKLRRNPSYFDNIGYEVTNVRGQRISSSSVNWNNVGEKFPFNVRQPPGRKNALGELKIMFPNKHSIYMHDTPAKSLFKRDKRAFSHGCVRLAEPRAMAAAVLGSDIGSISAKISTGANGTQKLKRKIPVYVAYFTAWPESDGSVKFFDDMYGRDKALEKAMEKEQKARAKARST